MTPSEVQNIASTGQAIYYNTIIYITTWFFFGLYSLIASVTLYVYFRCYMISSSSPRKPVLACILVMLILTNTWNYVCQWVLHLSRIRIVVSPQIAMLAFPWYAQSVWPQNICMIICNIFVTQRVCAVWPHSKSIRYTLAGFTAADSALKLANCIVNNLKLSVVHNVHLASTFFSIALGVTYLFFFALKAWHHHHATSVLYSTHKKQLSPATRIILLMFESGILVFASELLIAILSIIGRHTVEYSALDLWHRIMIEVFAALMALFPFFLVFCILVIRFPHEESFHHDDLVIHFTTI
ncbi:hypothetical protein BDP27DRAFT_1342475, partial [Rhodocollybia butyracea]